jgi:hypothetical protein
LKYSRYYGRRGRREAGYDNERGKGDHRHFQGKEYPYAFTTVEQLMVDLVRCADSTRRKMSEVKITVGGALEADASRRFVDAWHRAEGARNSANATWHSKAGMPSRVF